MSAAASCGLIPNEGNKGIIMEAVVIIDTVSEPVVVVNKAASKNGNKNPKFPAKAENPEIVSTIPDD